MQHEFFADTICYQAGLCCQRDNQCRNRVTLYKTSARLCRDIYTCTAIKMLIRVPTICLLLIASGRSIDIKKQVCTYMYT